MNKKLMEKLGLTEEDLTKKDQDKQISEKQEMLESTIDYMLTEVIPLMIGEE